MVLGGNQLYLVLKKPIRTFNFYSYDRDCDRDCLPVLQHTKLHDCRACFPSVARE